MRPTPKQIVSALRCSASASSECQREACPYCIVATEEDVRELFGDRVVLDMAKAISILTDCGCDKMATDAADLIEELTGGKADGRI